MTQSLGTRTTSMRLSGRRLAGVVLGLAAVGIGFWMTRRGAHSKEVGPRAARRHASSPGHRAWRSSGPSPGDSADDPAAGVDPLRSSRLTCTRWSPAISRRQEVDIGSRIKQGEVLAEINVPRDAKAVEEAASLVEQAAGPGRPGRGPDQGGRGPARRRRRPRPGSTESDLERLVGPSEARREAVCANQRPGRRAGGHLPAGRRTAERPPCGDRRRANRFGSEIHECQGEATGRRGRHRSGQGRRRREPGRAWASPRHAATA